ncbi:MAG: L,D-transpeptidase [Cohnella sp.]|nr:L,D-transpeptidase [Cohnella sp.]
MANYRIVINLSGRTLQLYDGEALVRTYPVGIGTIATATPTGRLRIVNKTPNPGGPYGAFWMGLSKPHYGIHGTNDPSSIGKRVSHGCIRMYNQDVTQLAQLVPIGTTVTIQN